MPRRPSSPIQLQDQARKFLLALGLLWLALYSSFALFRPPLLDDADSVHAEVAREMLVRHDPVTLYANGIRYLEKAPLMYWSMAASYAVFGVHDWSARLPLAIYTLALILSLFAGGRILFIHSWPGSMPVSCSCLVRRLHLYADHDSRHHGLPVLR